ncbi:unnamed protein product [Rotaria sordida]|uniref:phosphatidate phosphatase n=1 Tax=Rotaria sordida TaxID=392033 RepID=A0A819F744_9BILA|nr:unnamed protein product [Rotaria sordida]CAF3861603.1 unnamed protein product [Rotaria sordida]
MTSLTRIFGSLKGSLKSAYNNINPSTLTGAIDIIVVKQEDGTLRCTPFHVRFGKLGVLRNQQNKVYITINGNAVEDLFMELGEAGEALFIEEETTTQNLSPNRHLEPSDSSIFLDPDGAILTNSHPQLSIIDCTPQIINKQLDEEKAHENNESSVPKYAYEQPSISSINVDVLNSNVIISNRHQQRRRTINRMEQIHKDLNHDEDQEVEKIFLSNSNSSRLRRRTSTSISMNDKLTNHKNNKQIGLPLKLSRRHSASENDLLLFEIDGDEKESTSSPPFVDAHSRMNSIDSRKKLFIIPPRTSNDIDDDDESYSSSLEDDNNNDNSDRNIRTLSNPIPIEQKSIINDITPTTDESNSLINTIFSQSAPITINDNTIPIRMTQSTDSASFYLNESYSPATSYENAMVLRPPSPQSDTEYELDKSSQQSVRNNRTNSVWQWKWGEFPEQRRSVFRYLWPSSSSSSSKQKTPKEGMYLDDITNNKCDDRARYLPQMDYHLNQPRTPKDDDQESGTGNSIPHSPIREYETSYLLGDVQLSLCGNLDKPSLITDDLFYAHLISYEKFANNPSIINDPNLVVRIGGKYHNWNVASALIASASVYHKQLPPEIVEQLQKKHMIPTTPRTTGGISLWPFSGKNSNTKTETTSSAGAEALALVVKSEIFPTILQNQNSNRKNSIDTEQADHEVRKLTHKMESQQSISTKKKTMILTSDQLKQLNLKSGRNQVEFSVTTALQGTTIVEANIFFFDYNTKFVISDIDGTITKSDVFGHIFPLFGKDWSHDGIAEFFQAIQENGYQFIYLSARAIGQSRVTRNFLRSIKQCGFALPIGPLLISPDTLVTALYREVIARTPEDFKIECLKNIASLFPDKNPFYAGFGNRLNDQWAYTAVGIPETRIFTINPRGEVVRQKLSQVLCTSYKNLHEVVDQVFPPMDSFSASESYSSFTFWRKEPIIDSLENEMRQHVEEMLARQKSKGKGSTSGSPPKTTPTTTLTKGAGEKVLTIAQATENTVKKP